MAGKQTFSKRDTSILKGIAMLAMVWHHALTNDPSLTYSENIAENGYLAFPVVIAQLCKLCVPLFAILSGIGMTYGYRQLQDHSPKKAAKYVVSHLVQLYSVWFVALVTTYISFAMNGKDYTYFYEDGIKSIIKCVIDILGIAGLAGTRTVIGVGWFMSAIVVYYILFPVLFWVCKKIGILAVALSYIPWIIYLILPGTPFHTDSWLFYLSAFMLGIVLVQKNYLDNLKEKAGVLPLIISFVVLVLAAALRIAIALPGDLFLAAALIFFVVELSRVKIPLFWDLLVFIGANSAYMWLVHGHIMHTYIFLDKPFFEFVVVTFFSLGTSLLFKNLGDLAGYSRLVKRIRDNLK